MENLERLGFPLRKELASNLITHRCVEFQSICQELQYELFGQKYTRATRHDENFQAEYEIKRKAILMVNNGKFKK